MQEFQLPVRILKIKLINLKKKGVQFGRKAILNSKEKNVIYKEHEKGKSVAWLSKFFHVARNTIYRAIKDVAKKK